MWSDLHQEYITRIAAHSHRQKAPGTPRRNSRSRRSVAWRHCWPQEEKTFVRTIWLYTMFYRCQFFKQNYFILLIWCHFSSIRCLFPPKNIVVSIVIIIIVLRLLKASWSAWFRQMVMVDYFMFLALNFIFSLLIHHSCLWLPGKFIFVGLR